MKHLPRRSFELSPKKRALLEALLQEEGVESVPLSEIVRRTGNDTPLLSFAQQQLWFLDQWEPENSFYTITRELLFSGPLQRAVLEQSLNEIVRRHESLRTTFVVVTGQPVQVIAPLLLLPLCVVDLRDLPGSRREIEVRRLESEEAQQPFDLAVGPLVRACLLQIAQEEHALLLTVHHIVADGWSLGVFFQELLHLYDAFSSGKPSPLPDPPIQYADFALWQRQRLQGETLASQLAYWRQQLGNAPAVLELPTDRPRPKVQTFRGAHSIFTFPQRLSEELKALSEREEVTLFMTLLAAFQALLFRYTGQEDILVGTPIANRTWPELEGLIGCFVNTLVLRTGLSGDPGFLELLSRVREVALAAYAHQDLPFEQVVEAVQPNRDQSRNPLFQVMFVLQNAPMPALELPGLHLLFQDVKSKTAQFDMTLFVQDTVQGLRVALEYNTDLFESTTIVRMVGHFQTLLEGIIAHPEARLSNLPLLTATERHQLLCAWNDRTTEASWNNGLHEIFEKQVEQTPASIAVVCEDQQLTYQELNRRANRLAHQLRILGVGQETLVALLDIRGINFLLALLAVFKAGGAYLPLDQSQPVARLRQVLESSGCEFVLYTAAFTAILSQALADMPTRARPQRERLEYLIEQGEVEENLPTSTIPGQRAYVIYTSGSTGVPKGVIIEQRGMLNHLFAKISALHLSATDRVAQTASQCFDISVWQFLAALLVGGCVHIIPDDVAHDPLQLIADIERSEVSILETVPSLLNVVLEVIEKDTSLRPDLKQLRWLIPTGEALPSAVAYHWLMLYPQVPLLNAYGPTECSDDVTHFVLSEPLTAPAAHIPIGRPVENTRIYILNRTLHPQPVGINGELYVGGVGVGRGYAGDAVRTAEAFIPDPFSDEPGVRLYKTGDLARYLSDGTIEFLGRIDHQVKVRGYRIELEEIEVALSNLPNVREAVVWTYEALPGDKRLVAYLILHRQEPFGDLRNSLKAKLPEYMIPSAFMVLDRLPLTPNGKLDHAALPAPDLSQSIQEWSSVGPRSPIEEALVEIWASVLGRENIEIHDNFFDLGGHSLLATQVIARIRLVLQVEVPLRTLFEAPTIANLTSLIEEANRSRKGLSIQPMIPARRTGQIPLAFAQERLWFLDQWQSNNYIYNIPVALRITGRIDIAALHESIHEIVRRHEILRTTFAAVNGHSFQVIAPILKLPLPIVDLQALSKPAERNAEMKWLAGKEARGPFDLGQGPLIRVGLLRLDREEHVLLLTLHHIISDGWSMGVLLRELGVLYAAFSSQQPVPLPKPFLQYRDYVIWQREQLQGDILENQLTYWKDRLKGAPAVLELPVDRPRPAVQTFRGTITDFAFPAVLLDALKMLSRQAGVTLFMLLLAAFKTLLYRYTKQEDIVVGVPAAGRARAEIEGMIGLFVNMLVLRTDLSGNPTFRELLEQEREVALGAFAHQDLPFERLVEVLQPVRDLRYSPLFQVAFTMQNVPLPGLAMGDLQLQSLEVESGVAKFDLTLSVWDKTDALLGSVEYNTDLFDTSTIARMIGHLQTLLEGIVMNVKQNLAGLPLLTKAERNQLLLDWNDTRTAYPENMCIHQLFEVQVERSPEAIALASRDEQITYRELNRRANQLAHYLQALGVGPEVLVGLCVRRSPEMIIGLLGILKAGGGYVPLDPLYPQERLTFMLQDARISMLLTQQRLVERLPEHPARVICLDTDWEAIASKSAANPDTRMTSDNLAYVIYTSGSTGRPKGVLVPHRGLCNLFGAQTWVFGVQPSSRVLQFASLNFDASAFDIFMTLLAGAALYLETQDALLPDLTLLRLLREQAITTITLPSSVLAMLSVTDLPELQTVISTGEACSAELVARWAVKRKFFNGYGPTEATIGASFAACGNDNRKPPIGRPITNMQVYVLDDRLEPVPIGIPGEIYVGGAGLTRGYLNRPELTAERFIPHPFSTEAGARLYKTGDLARYLTDGNLDFLGRVDQQVKLRGYRIELGEIKSVLEEHRAVREAMVLVRESAANDKRLVAYIIPHLKQAPPAQTLRAFLKERLPEYMLPAAFVVLDAWPLSPNGKLDYRALPNPDLSHQPSAAAYVMPRSELEQTIATAWMEVLHAEKVGAYDNFFDLGGHSLLMVQLQSKLRDILQRDLAMLDLFKYPTVSSLAEFLSQKRNEQPAAQQRNGRNGTPEEGKHRLKQQLEQKQRAAKKSKAMDSTK